MFELKLDVQYFLSAPGKLAGTRCKPQSKGEGEFHATLYLRLPYNRTSPPLNAFSHSAIHPSIHSAPPQTTTRHIETDPSRVVLYVCHLPTFAPILTV